MDDGTRTVLYTFSSIFTFFFFFVTSFVSFTYQNLYAVGFVLPFGLLSAFYMWKTY